MHSYVLAFVVAIFFVAMIVTIVATIVERRWYWFMAAVLSILLFVTTFSIGFSTTTSEDIQVITEYTIDIGQYELIDIGTDESIYVEVVGTKYHAVYRSKGTGDLTSVNVDVAKDSAAISFNFEGDARSFVSVHDHVSEIKRWCLFFYADDKLIERQYTFNVPQGTVKGLEETPSN